MVEEKVKELLEGLCISFQEEATSKHSSATERICFTQALSAVRKVMLELGLEDE